MPRTPVAAPSHSGGVPAWLHDAGPGTPAVAIAHGSGSAPREYFGHEASVLHENGLTVLVAAKDMAGYGSLHRSYDVLADDLASQAAWLRGRGHPRVTLLGFSEGTWVATIAAARAGVADAVVLCSPPIVGAGDQTAHELLCWWPRQLPGRRRAHDALQRGLQATAGYLRRDADAELAALTVPVLAIWGRDDPLVDVPRARAALTRRCPGAEQLVLDGTGHGLRGQREGWLARAAAVARPTA